MTLQRKNFVDIYYRNIEAGIANEVDSVVFLQRFCLSTIDVVFRTIVLNNHNVYTCLYYILSTHLTYYLHIFYFGRDMMI